VKAKTHAQRTRLISISIFRILSFVRASMASGSKLLCEKRSTDLPSVRCELNVGKEAGLLIN